MLRFRSDSRFPECNREFIYRIDPMVLLSRIGPARKACRGRL
jgi:hypothetical protein